MAEKKAQQTEISSFINHPPHLTKFARRMPAQIKKPIFPFHRKKSPQEEGSFKERYFNFKKIRGIKGIRENPKIGFFKKRATPKRPEKNRT